MLHMVKAFSIGVQSISELGLTTERQMGRRWMEKIKRPMKGRRTEELVAE